jgi:hypothetical protein
MMSSEASTESRVSQDAQASDSLQPWQLFTLAGLIGATIAVFMSRGQSPASVVLISLTIFAAAGVGVAALRMFMPLTARMVNPGSQILGGRTRAALEREKALVLRSIKDLEFDRAMGKLSEKDFTEMGSRLRARAAGLIRQLDAGTGYRDQIEREIERRVGKGSATKQSDGFKIQDPAGTPEAHAGSQKQDPAYVQQQDPAYAVCGQCETKNDLDARFCKGCGANLRPTS